jgi:flavin-dependent dehydrogenase
MSNASEHLASAKPAPIEGGLPIILGAGLTGVAISRALSKAGIRHLLIGEPPGGEPRLGESLNAEGSIEILELFREHREYFHPKNRLAVFYGPNALAFDFEAAGCPRASLEAFGFPTAVAQLHVDRLGFDKAVFEAAIEDPCCSHVEGRAVELDYHPGADRVLAVELADGRVVEPAYVFDCSNQARFVARRIGLGCDLLGAEQRVVFAHCRRAGSDAPVREPRFADATSLLRLSRPDDPIDALGWCIPLGEYVSIGLNVDADQVTRTGASLFQLALDGYAARGVDVLGHFPHKGAPVDIRYRHYACERAFGGNWLLAGPSFCQTWFPSGAGVGTALIAARFAADVLSEPRRAGALYEAYMRRIVATHATMEWLSADAPRSVSAGELLRRAAAMTRANAKRLSFYLAARGDEGTPAMRSAAARVYESDRIWATGCRVVSAPAEEQGLRLLHRRGRLLAGEAAS